MRYILLLYISIIFVSCDLKSSEEYHKDANKLEAKEKYQEAIKLLDKAIEKNPNNIKALLDRGVDKSILKDYQGAILDYSRVIQLDRNNGLAFLNRGKNKNALGNYNEAIATKGGEFIYTDKVENPYVENGFEFDVLMEEIKYERGLSYYNIDSLRSAFDDINFSIQKKFALPHSYYMRGVIYLRYNMTTEGCQDLLKSMKLGNKDAINLINQNCK